MRGRNNGKASPWSKTSTQKPGGQRAAPVSPAGADTCWAQLRRLLTHTLSSGASLPTCAGG